MAYTELVEFLEKATKDKAIQPINLSNLIPISHYSDNESLPCICNENDTCLTPHQNPCITLLSHQYKLKALSYCPLVIKDFFDGPSIPVDQLRK